MESHTKSALASLLRVIKDPANRTTVGTVSVVSAGALLLYLFRSSFSSTTKPLQNTSPASTITLDKIHAIRAEIEAGRTHEALLDAELAKLEEQRRKVRQKERLLHESQQALNQEIALHYSNSATAIVKDTNQKKEQILQEAEHLDARSAENQQNMVMETEINVRDRAGVNSGEEKNQTTPKRRRKGRGQLSMHMSPSSKCMMDIFRRNAAVKRAHFTAWAQYMATRREPESELEPEPDVGEEGVRDAASSPDKSIDVETFDGSATGMMTNADWDKFLNKAKLL